MTPDMMREAKRIVWAELPKYLTEGEGFVIDEIQSEILDGPFCEDYMHLNVILEDGHPDLDARKTVKFRHEMYTLFESAGVIPVPAISFSDRSEFPRR